MHSPALVDGALAILLDTPSEIPILMSIEDMIMLFFHQKQFSRLWVQWGGWGWEQWGMEIGVGTEGGRGGSRWYW